MKDGIDLGFDFVGLALTETQAAETGLGFIVLTADIRVAEMGTVNDALCVSEPVDRVGIIDSADITRKTGNVTKVMVG